MVLRLFGQSSTGPSLVLDQSVARMSARISPSPENSASVGLAGGSALLHHAAHEAE
jgi:hypothetical protein